MNTILLITAAILIFSMGTHAHILQLEKTTHAEEEVKTLNEQLDLQVEYNRQLAKDYETIGLQIESLIDPVYQDLLELDINQAADLLKIKRRLEKRRQLTLKPTVYDQTIYPKMEKQKRPTRGSELLLNYG